MFIFAQMNDITCIAFVCSANVRTDEQQREALGGDGDIHSVQVSVLSEHTHLSSKMAQITCDIRENRAECPRPRV